MANHAVLLDRCTARSSIVAPNSWVLGCRACGRDGPRRPRRNGRAGVVGRDLDQMRPGKHRFAKGHIFRTESFVVAAPSRLSGGTGVVKPNEREAGPTGAFILFRSRLKGVLHCHCNPTLGRGNVSYSNARRSSTPSERPRRSSRWKATRAVRRRCTYRSTGFCWRRRRCCSSEAGSANARAWTRPSPSY
jgi:hypothetical protein